MGYYCDGQQEFDCERKGYNAHMQIQTNKKEEVVLNSGTEMRKYDVIGNDVAEGSVVELLLRHGTIVDKNPRKSRSFYYYTTVPLGKDERIDLLTVEYILKAVEKSMMQSNKKYKYQVQIVHVTMKPRFNDVLLKYGTIEQGPFYARGKWFFYETEQYLGENTRISIADVLTLLGRLTPKKVEIEPIAVYESDNCLIAFESTSKASRACNMVQILDQLFPSYYFSFTFDNGYYFVKGRKQETKKTAATSISVSVDLDTKDAEAAIAKLTEQVKAAKKLYDSIGVK